MNKFLVSNGYNMWKEENDEFGTKWQYQKRLDIFSDWDESTPLCLCNDKFLINIREVNYTHPSLKVISEKSNTFEVYICHENKNGEWCNLSIYSLRQEDIESNLNSYESRLVNIWKEFNKF